LPGRPTKEFEMHDYRLDEREQPKAIRTPSSASRSRRGARYRAAAVSCLAASSMDRARSLSFHASSMARLLLGELGEA